MAIIAQCPRCKSKQSLKNKVCSRCGLKMDPAKRSGRVRYLINYREMDLKKDKMVQKNVPVASYEGLNGFSLDDARKAENKRFISKAEMKPNPLEMTPGYNTTFNELAEWYLSLEKVKALASFPTIKIYLNKFNKVFGDTIVRDIKPAHLENHQERRKGEGYKPKTIDDELNYIKTVVIKAFDNDLIGGDALKAFRRVKRLLSGNKKGSNSRNRVLTRNELGKVLSCVKEPHTADLLNFGDWTGMRAGEIMKLKWDMVDLKNRVITLPHYVTKERKEKRVPIGDMAYRVLTRDNRHIRKAGDVDHVFTYWGKPITRQFTTGFKTAATEAGVPWGRDVKEGWVFHDLRRTFKTDLRKAGVHKIVIDSILGHSNTNDMDSTYNIVDDQDRLDAISKLEGYRKNINQEHTRMAIAIMVVLLKYVEANVTKSVTKSGAKKKEAS